MRFERSPRRGGAGYAVPRRGSPVAVRQALGAGFREVVMRLVGAIAVGFGLLSAATTAAQRSPVPLTEAERAIRTEKGAVLVAALKRESPIEPERLAEVIRVALVDTDAAIRELAVATISARNLAPTLQRSSAEVKSEWERERPALQRLRPMVVQALDDENARVREGAVGALQSFDFDGTQPYGRMLSAETTVLLARRYGREPSPTGRAVIVSVLGGSAKQNPAALDTLRAATRDEAAMVRQVALKGMMESGPEAGLPAVVAAFTDSDAIVRGEAAAQLMRAGTAAKPYVRQIEAALKNESDGATRANLTRVAERLR